MGGEARTCTCKLEEGAWSVGLTQDGCCHFKCHQLVVLEELDKRENKSREIVNFSKQGAPVSNG